MLTALSRRAAPCRHHRAVLPGLGELSPSFASWLWWPSATEGGILYLL